MKIQNSTKYDIEEIFRLYNMATNFQKTRFNLHWPVFEKSLIKTEIKEHRQWKLVINNTIACIWATTFNDPQIWGEKNNDPSVYIHRIATNPDYKGRNFVLDIVDWAKEYAHKHDKKFIRMDTVGENLKLIAHYEKCGFSFLGLSQLTDTNGLPAHYTNAAVCLFEMIA